MLRLIDITFIGEMNKYLYHKPNFFAKANSNGADIIDSI